MARPKSPTKKVVVSTTVKPEHLELVKSKGIPLSYVFEKGIEALLEEEESLKTLTGIIKVLKKLKNYMSDTVDRLTEHVTSLSELKTDYESISNRMDKILITSLSEFLEDFKNTMEEYKLTFKNISKEVLDTAKIIDTYTHDIKKEYIKKIDHLQRMVYLFAVIVSKLIGVRKSNILFHYINKLDVENIEKLLDIKLKDDPVIKNRVLTSNTGEISDGNKTSIENIFDF